MTDSIDFGQLAALAGLNADQAQLAQLFMPHAIGRQMEIFTKQIRFVHYTTAEAAVSMLRTKEIWLRSVACMNDYLEVQYGLDHLLAACRSDAYNSRLNKFLGAFGDKFASEFDELFTGWQSTFFNDTYVACLSEHDSAEDIIGRLSMWRAYGRQRGVAFVINTGVFHTGRSSFGATTSPVAYLSKEQFDNEFGRLLNGIEGSIEFLKTQDREIVKGMLFNAFRFAALSTKHPGFHEEREWRVVHSPRLDTSAHLTRDVVVINGVPQPIYKIPLRDYPDDGLVGLEVPSLIERLIIGPTEYASATYQAFVDLLRDAGVTEPEKSVFVSNIPIRSPAG